MNKTWILLHLHCSIQQKYKSAEVPEFPRLHTNFHSHNINTAHVVRCRDDTWTQCHWHLLIHVWRGLQVKIVRVWRFKDYTKLLQDSKFNFGLWMPIYRIHLQNHACVLNTLTISFIRVPTWPQVPRLGRWAMCCSLSCCGQRYVVIQPGSKS